MLVSPNSTLGTPVIAIAGGGFAGTMTAVHLLRAGTGPLEIVLLDRDGSFGPGVAYGTVDAAHLLNVPVELMSAFCEQPLHFAAWARRETGASAPAEFMPRPLFGEYLRSVLADAERQSPPQRRLTRLSAEVTGASGAGARLRLALADGSRLDCDRLVLALGPLAGAPAFELPEDERIVLDPWSRPGGVRAAEGERTLVLGMGLTAVDTILSLTAGTGRGEVVAISRSGAFPHRHLPGLRFPAPAPTLPTGPVDLAELEALVRGHLAELERDGHDWRDGFDGLRSITPALWGRLSHAGREQFLERRMREWERRRHRMAPAVAAQLDGLAASGRLSTLAAGLRAVDASGPRLRVRVEIGPGRRTETIECDRVVVCTGAGMDVRQSGNPLLADLLRSGAVLPDALGLGLRATPAGALLDGISGRPHGRLFGLGAIRRGELWETTAVGEIRVQARDLALEISRSLSGEPAPAEPCAAPGAQPSALSARPPV